MGSSEAIATEAAAGFSHEALLYSTEDAYLDATARFIRDSLDAQAPVMVAIGRAKIERLTSVLGGAAERVLFVDMAVVGSNPARIIPAWHDFVAEHWTPELGVRGIGEPIWAERGAAELVECQRHEALLNLAFADTPAFRLLCPYDTRALPADVIHEAACSHPILVEDGSERDSADYRGLDAIAAAFDAPLAPAPQSAVRMTFAGETLRDARLFLADRARDAGLDFDRTADLLIAVNELAANSVRHGGGTGELAVWSEGGVLYCEVTDSGHIGPPLAGRKRPTPTQEHGWGLWLANQVCDLVQVRTFPTGNVVRVHMSLD
jgi:anti-sigma regulatory factor (Ser/Thr protein kinase)